VLVALLSVPAPVAGEIIQVTPLLVGSFWVVAVIDCVVPTTTVIEDGETETATIGGGVVLVPPPQPLKSALPLSAIARIADFLIRLLEFTARLSSNLVKLSFRFREIFGLGPCSHGVNDGNSSLL
jgi:hypothetical protein